MRENSGRGRHAIHVVVLQCGDPSATGAGRPGYRFINEYPTNQYRLTDPALQLVVRHPPGTLATGDGARLGDRVATADTVGPYAEYLRCARRYRHVRAGPCYLRHCSRSDLEGDDRAQGCACRAGPAPWRCSTIPMTHSSSAPRSARSRAAKAWPQSS